MLVIVIRERDDGNYTIIFHREWGEREPLTIVVEAGELRTLRKMLNSGLYI